MPVVYGLLVGSDISSIRTASYVDFPETPGRRHWNDFLKGVTPSSDSTYLGNRTFLQYHLDSVDPSKIACSSSSSTVTF